MEPATQSRELTVYVTHHTSSQNHAPLTPQPPLPRHQNEGEIVDRYCILVIIQHHIPGIS